MHFNDGYERKKFIKEHEKMRKEYRKAGMSLDEISSYEDMPSELIFDEYENLLFDGHPLKHHILVISDRYAHSTPRPAARF